MTLFPDKQVNVLNRFFRPTAPSDALGHGLVHSKANKRIGFLSNLGQIRGLRVFQSAIDRESTETRRFLSIHRRVVQFIATSASVMAIFLSCVASARAETQNEQLVAMGQLRAVVQHGDLSDAAFVTKTFSLRVKKGEIDWYESDGSPSLFRPFSLSYSVIGPGRGKNRSAMLSIMGPELCIEHRALHEVFGEKNRVYRSTTKAEQEKEAGLLYQYEFGSHTITANFVFLSSRPCMQSALIQQRTKGSESTQKIKIQRRWTPAQQADHLMKILAIAQHDDLRDVAFVEATLGMDLRKSTNEYGPSNKSVDFDGPWLNYRGKAPWATLDIHYDQRQSCLDTVFVPAIIGRPHNSGVDDLLFRDSRPEGEERFFRYDYAQRHRTRLTFYSVDGCLTEASIKQSAIYPNQLNK